MGLDEESGGVNAWTGSLKLPEEVSLGKMSGTVIRYLGAGD